MAVWDTSEEQYLNLDSSGYPITLTTVNDPNPKQFTSLAVVLLYNLPNTSNGYYPAGQYVVLYDGQGTMTYGFDAILVSSSTGRDVINVATPSGGGLFINITSTDPNNVGDYIRNIRVVNAQNEAALDAGQIFNPNFLAAVKNFRALRFMDWLDTNYTPLSSWTDRPLPTDAFWGTSKGVPLEIAVALANAISADAWLNAPVMADDNYITQMATLVNNLLGPSQRAYVELGNEVWNASFSANAYSIAQGRIAFPNQSNQYYAGWEWYGQRVAQMADIWHGIYGSTAFDSRVMIVMAGQAANTAVLQAELSTPDWTGAGNGPAASHHIGAAAIAPYFLSSPSAADLNTMLAQPDGGLTDMFATVYAQSGFPSVAAGGWLAQVGGWISSHSAMLASSQFGSYGIPLVAYEGGQSLEGFPTYLDGSPQVNLFIAANRDPRMAAAYTAYFNEWKTNGGTLLMNFSDSGASSQYGEWGALESIMQTVAPLSSAPPKWQAIQNFISATPCWWAGCASADP